MHDAASRPVVSSAAKRGARGGLVLKLAHLRARQARGARPLRRARIPSGATFFAIEALGRARRLRPSNDAAIALLFAASMSFGSCAKHDAPPVAPMEPGSEGPAHVPPALLDVATGARAVFDDAHGADWVRASEDLPEIEAKLIALETKARRRDEDDAQYEALHRAIAELRRSVEAQDRVATMRAAADVALAAGELETRMRPAVPPLVPRLERSARAILIAIDTGDRAALARSITRAESTWRDLRDAVASHGGRALALRTDRTFESLRTTRANDAIARLAEDLLEEADAMSALFS